MCKCTIIGGVCSVTTLVDEVIKVIILALKMLPVAVHTMLLNAPREFSDDAMVFRANSSSSGKIYHRGTMKICSRNLISRCWNEYFIKKKSYVLPMTDKLGSSPCESRSSPAPGCKSKKVRREFRRNPGKSKRIVYQEDKSISKVKSEAVPPRVRRNIKWYQFF